MSATRLDDPAAVMVRLAEIENELCEKQNAWESAALAWFRSKRDREHDRAVEFLRAEGTVAERSATADSETALKGKEDEALYEALKAVIRVLETRASIGQSILRAQGRA
jgi:hypothetical protein